MKIAIVQTLPAFGDPAANLAALVRAMDSARADFYVLPELCLSGYDFDDRAEALRFAEPPDGPHVEALAAHAAGRGAGIAFGFAESAPATIGASPDGLATGGPDPVGPKAGGQAASGPAAGAPGSGERVYNSAMLAFPDGRRRVYRKTHLFNREKLCFDPGDTGFFVEEFRGTRIGPAICFDWMFPESFRTLAMLGADLVAHCSNLVMAFCQRADFARAVENGVYVATANRVGTEARHGRKLSFTGGSVLVAPDGEYLLRLPEAEPAVQVAEIRPARARNKQINDWNDLLRDRRPEFYFREGPKSPMSLP